MESDFLDVETESQSKENKVWSLFGLQPTFQGFLPNLHTNLPPENCPFSKISFVKEKFAALRGMFKSPLWTPLPGIQVMSLEWAYGMELEIPVDTKACET